jgi:hypothetical protein
MYLYRKGMKWSKHLIRPITIENVTAGGRKKSYKTFSSTRAWPLVQQQYDFAGP